MLDQTVARLRMRVNHLRGRPALRVVFLHIPKCAGSSINAHFKSNYGSQRSGQTVLLDSMEGSAYDQSYLERAQKARYVAGHFGWRTLTAVAENAFRFTILREPFERLRSLYLYSKSLSVTLHCGFSYLSHSAKQLTFPDFCLDPDPRARAMIDNAMTRSLTSDYFPFAPCSAHTRAEALANLRGLDRVLDAGALDQDLETLAAETGTKVIRNKKRVNVTPPNAGLDATRHEFLRDRRLRALIEHDLALYEEVGARAMFGAVKQA